MENSLNQIINKFFGVLIIVFIIFMVGLINGGVSEKLLMYNIFFLIVLLVICGLFILILSKRIEGILQNLSDSMEHIINGSSDEIFSTTEDNILSKLQFKLNKLSGILISNRERANIEKDNIQELVSDICHQLKTPLTNLNMYTEFLFSYELDEVKKEQFSNNIKGQISKLNWLMEALIKMSRLESGIISIHKEVGNINETIKKSLEQVKLLAEDKGVNISFEESDNILIEHDRKWTSEAIFNLVDNAVKYGEANGQIHIDVHTYEIFLRIDVIDNGKGIKEEEINDIFKRFYRGYDSRNIEGAGIGLYLVREIISKQGGYVKVESKPEEGSKFSLFIPR